MVSSLATHFLRQLGPGSSSLLEMRKKTTVQCNQFCGNNIWPVELISTVEEHFSGSLEGK